jgi:hypothetical protein
VQRVVDDKLGAVARPPRDQRGDGAGFEGAPDMVVAVVGVAR